MINNRQNGRRRGRGGQQPRNNQPGNPHSNSRVDNRQRGNAAQLFEKYKTLARDAQMQGDRVNTEYYLQFADHYFRVLSENRSRYEEQRRPRDEQGQDYGTEDEGDGQRGYAPRDFSDDGWDEAEQEREQQEAAPQQQPQHQPQRAAPNQPQHQGNRRQPYAPRVNGNGNAGNGNGAYAAPLGEGAPPANGGNGFAAPAPDANVPEAAPSRIAIELPPALTPRPSDDAAPAPIAAEGAEQEPAPKRRRGRKPKVAEASQPDA